MSRGLSQKALSGAASLGAGTAVQMAFQVGTLAILARLLEPEDFGVFAAANVIVGFGRLLSDFAIGTVIVQRQALDDRMIRSAVTVSVLTGAVLAGALAIWGPHLERVVFDAPEAGAALQMMAPILLFCGLTAVGEALTARALRFKAIALISLIATIVFNCGLAIGLAYEGYGWRALALAALGRSAALALCYILLSRHSLRPLFEGRALRELLSTGVGLLAARAANYGATSGDSLMIGRLIGIDALGLYDRAFRLATLPSVIYSRSVSRVALSSMASVAGDRVRLSAGFRRGLALTALLGLPLSAALGLLGPEIVAILLGEQWSAAVPVFQALVFAAFLRLAYRVSQSVLLARGRAYRYAATQVAYAAAVISGVYLAAPHGLVGAAWAVNGAIALNFAILTQLALTEIGDGWGSLSVAAPGAVHGALTGVVVHVAATELRAVSAHPAAVVAGSVGAAALALLSLHIRGRSWLLGADGLWMRDLVLTRLRPFVMPPRGREQSQ